MDSSSCGDLTSSIISMKQAQISAQASMAAAKLVLDTQKEQGTQIVGQLMKSAMVQQGAIVDAAGRLDAIG